MQNLDHFADIVPQVTREALASLAEYVQGELDTYKNVESFGECQISPIYGKDPGGFIPFQFGGFGVSALIRFDCDTSYHVGGMSEAYKEYEKYCFESFLSDNNLPESTAYDDLTEEQSEALFEYEQEWFSDGALLRFECWQDKQERGFNTNAELGQIFLRLSVNYSDGPYFRTKDDETLHALSFSPEALQEAVKRWPDDWQARLYRQLLASDAIADEKGA